MKRKVIATVLAFCMTAGLLVGCGAPEPDEVETTAEAPAEETAAEAETEEAPEAAAEGAAEGGTYRVGLMIPGTLGDKSFFDAAFASIEPLKSELGVEVEYVEA